MGQDDKSSRQHATDAVLRNIQVAGRRTSVRMERLHWRAIDVVCASERLSLNEFCELVDLRRDGTGLTAALRLTALDYILRFAHTRGLVGKPLSERVLNELSRVDEELNDGRKITISGCLNASVDALGRANTDAGDDETEDEESEGGGALPA